MAEILNFSELLNPERDSGDFKGGWYQAPMGAGPCKEPATLETFMNGDSFRTDIAPIEAKPLEESLSLDDALKASVPSCTRSPICEDTPSERDLTAKLAVLFAKPAPVKAVGDAFSDDKMGIAVTQIAEVAASSGEFAMIDDSLCVYHTPDWKLLSRIQAESEVKAWIAEHLGNSSISPRNIKEIVHALQTDTRISRRRRDFHHNELFINFKDAVLDVVSGKVLPPSPSYGFFRHLDISVNQIGQGPHRYFDQFVETAFAGSEKSYQAALEMLGISVSGFNLKKLFVLMGPSHTGKSQWGVFLQQLLGDENTTAVASIDDFAREWTTGSLINKRICTCLDLPDTYLSEKVISILKQIVGDDTILGNVKYKNPVQFHSETVLLFATNYKLKIPHVLDAKPFLNRIAVIPFCNPVPEGEQIPQLYEKLLDEAPYIVGQAVIALRQLAERNFVLTEAMPVADALYFPEFNASDETSFIISRFVNEECILEEGTATTSEDLYRAYLTFCKAVGVTAGSDIDFIRKLKVISPLTGQLSSVKRVGEKGLRGIGGIRLRNPSNCTDTLFKGRENDENK